MNALQRLANYARRKRYKWDVRRVPRLWISEPDLHRQGYHSQYGQDKLVAETLLPGLRNGVFVDIGAHDGVTLSNTLYFEEKLGWTGVAIEPNPAVFARLQKNRRCATVNAGVAKVTSRQKFRVVNGPAEMLSGLVTEYDARHEERIAREVRERGGSMEEIEIYCWNFTELMHKHGITKVDYLSIDVEGGEWAIVSGMDWSALPIRVVGVENNYNERRVMQFLKKQGYRVAHIAGDEFYVKDVH
jgi:FkbM family methyltransferase